MRTQAAAAGSGARRTATHGAYVLEGYESLDVIGSGTFGLIRKVRRKSDGMLFARKELNFERMNERDRKHIVSEVNILRTLQHPNVVRYEERYVDTETGILYIVMELCEGGDLGMIIKRNRRARTHVPEDTVWSYFAQMVAALEACHYRSTPSAPTSRLYAHAILHRDLKPENVFLDTNENVKLGDFGLSKQIAAQAFANTYVGTPYYMSPELATGQQYDIKSDIWALGCIVYELCALSPPFDASNHMELTRKIKQGTVPALPRMYSRELQDTVNAMLQLDHHRRPTTRQLLQVKQVKLAYLTHELANLHRTVQLDKEHVQAQTEALDAREASVQAREKEIEQQSITLAHNMHASQTAALEEREAAVQKSQEAVAAYERELLNNYNAWYHGERVALQKAAAEKDTLISQLTAQLASMQTVEVEPSRRVSDPVMPGSLPRMHMPSHRISSQKRQDEVDDDLHARIAGGALSLLSPQSHEPKQADGWEDTEEQVPLNPALVRVRRLAQVDIKSDLSDCSMKDASTMFRVAPNDDEGHAQSMPTSVLANLSTPMRPKPMPFMDKEASPNARTLPSNLNVSPPDPQWRLLDESLQPSPFLKRVQRLPMAYPKKSAGDMPKTGPNHARFTIGQQENAGPVRQRASFVDRRRRSSLLRPADAMPAITKESSRMP
ncbi:Kin3p, partial [Malassezia vespertilionis]